VLGEELSLPFPRLSYSEAMARYGTDKPDIRFGLELADVTPVFAEATSRSLQGSSRQAAWSRP